MQHLISWHTCSGRDSVKYRGFRCIIRDQCIGLRAGSSLNLTLRRHKLDGGYQPIALRYVIILFAVSEAEVHDLGQQMSVQAGNERIALVLLCHHDLVKCELIAHQFVAYRFGMAQSQDGVVRLAAGFVADSGQPNVGRVAALGVLGGLGIRLTATGESSASSKSKNTI